MILIWLIFFCIFGFSSSTLFPSFNGYQLKELGSTTIETFNLESNNWTGSGLINSSKTTICRDFPLLGGYGMLTPDGYFERNYSFLPLHNAIYFEIKLVILDDWNPSDRFRIQFDKNDVSASIIGFRSSSFPSNICGSSNNDLEFLTIVGMLPHEASNLTLTVISNINRDPSIASLGIRDLSIIFVNNTLTSLQEKSCFHVSDVGVIQNGNSKECECQAGSYPDPSNSSNCLACNSNCSDCFGLSPGECYSCNPGYSFVQGECIQCHDSCNTCFGPNEDQCVTCSNNLWLLSNNTCSNTCESLLDFKEEIGDFRVCYLANTNINTNISNTSICNTSNNNNLNTVCNANQSNHSKELFSPGQEIQNEVAKTIEVTGGLATVGKIIISIASGSPSSLSLVSLAKMLHYIRYLDISYPPKVEDLFRNQNSTSISLNFSPNFPQEIEDEFPKHPLPAKFGQYNLHPSFIINFWEAFFTLGIILLIVFVSSIICFLAEKYKQKYIHTIFDKIKNVTKWDLFILILCSNYDGIALFSFFETTSIVQVASWKCIASFIACVIMNIFAIFLLAKTFFVIRGLRRVRYQIKDSVGHHHEVLSHKSSEFYGILFRGFKDETFMQQIFLLYFLLRIYVVDLIVGYLYSFPLAQSIILILISFLTLSYLISKRPFKEKSNLIEIFTYEVILLIGNIGVLILAILDSKKSDAFETRVSVGNLIIACNIIFNLFGLFFVSFEVVCGLVKAYKIIRQSKGRNIWLKIFVLIFERDGMAIETKEKNEKTISAKENFDIEIQPFEISNSNARISFNNTSKSQFLPQLIRKVSPILDVSIEKSNPLKNLEINARTFSESSPTCNNNLPQGLISQYRIISLKHENESGEQNDVKDESKKSSPSSDLTLHFPSRLSVIKIRERSDSFSMTPKSQETEMNIWDKIKLGPRKSQFFSSFDTSERTPNNKEVHDIKPFNRSMRTIFRERLKSIQVKCDEFSFEKKKSDRTINTES